MYRCEPILYKVFNNCKEKTYHNKMKMCQITIFKKKVLRITFFKFQVRLNWPFPSLNAYSGFNVYSTCTQVCENQTKLDMRVHWTVQSFKRIKKDYPDFTQWVWVECRNSIWAFLCTPACHPTKVNEYAKIFWSHNYVLIKKHEVCCCQFVRQTHVTVTKRILQ